MLTAAIEGIRGQPQYAVIFRRVGARDFFCGEQI